MLERLPKCKDVQSKPSVPTVDLGLVVDEARDSFHSLRLISFFAESIGISKFGSFLHVVNGANGDRLVNRTQSVTSAFEQLRNYTFHPSNGLLLSRSLATYLETISLQMLNEKRLGAATGLPLVLAIACKEQPITDHDFAAARRMIHRSIRQFPDLYILFITTDERFVSDLMYGSQDEHRHFHVNADVTDMQRYESELLRVLQQLPRRISPNCHLDRRSDGSEEPKLVK